MESNVRRVGITLARGKTYYERWMEKEGVPIVEGFGVTDVGRSFVTTMEPAWVRWGLSSAPRPRGNHRSLYRQNSRPGR